MKMLRQRFTFQGDLDKPLQQLTLLENPSGQHLVEERVFNLQNGNDQQKNETTLCPSLEVGVQVFDEKERSFKGVELIKDEETVVQ